MTSGISPRYSIYLPFRIAFRRQDWARSVSFAPLANDGEGICPCMNTIAALGPTSGGRLFTRGRAGEATMGGVCLDSIRSVVSGHKWFLRERNSAFYFRYGGQMTWNYSGVRIPLRGFSLAFSFYFFPPSILRLWLDALLIELSARRMHTYSIPPRTRCDLGWRFRTAGGRPSSGTVTLVYHCSLLPLPSSSCSTAVVIVEPHCSSLSDNRVRVSVIPWHRSRTNGPKQPILVITLGRAEQ